MESAKLTSRGQMVVPARIRRKYGMVTGTRVRFLEREGEIVLQPVTAEFIRGLRGILGDGGSATKMLLEERARDRRREEARGAKRGAR